MMEQLPTPERATKGHVIRRNTIIVDEEQQFSEKYFERLWEDKILSQEHAQILSWYRSAFEGSKMRSAKVSQSAYGEYQGDVTGDHQLTMADCYIRVCSRFNKLPYQKRFMYEAILEAVAINNYPLEQIAPYVRWRSKRLFVFPDLLNELKDACDYLLKARRDILSLT